MEAIWCPSEISDALMIPPNLLRLPIFSYFHFVIICVLLLVFEILLAYRQSISSTVSVVEDVLTLRNKFVTFELPQNGSAIITSACEKCANAIPSDAIHRLLVIAQLCQLSDGLDFLFFKQTLHDLNIGLESFILWIIVIQFLVCFLTRRTINFNFNFSFFRSILRAFSVDVPAR